jgi:hypothetical protein
MSVSFMSAGLFAIHQERWAGPLPRQTQLGIARHTETARRFVVFTDVLIDEVEAHQSLVRPGQYRHHKGRSYQVLGVVLEWSTREPLVWYVALYTEGKLAMALRPLEGPDGFITPVEGAPRFCRVRD